MAKVPDWRALGTRAWSTLQGGGKRWIDSESYRLAASLSYYALFSVFPLMLVAISVGEIVLGDSADMQRAAIQALNGSDSPAVRTVLQETILSAEGAADRSRWGVVIGVVVAAFGASGIFLELDGAFEKLFKVRAPELKLLESARRLLVDRASALLLVILTSVLLLAGQIALSAVNVIVSKLPGLAALPFFSNLAARVATDSTSVLVLGGALTLCYRMVPNCAVRWRAALIGGFAASLLLYLVRWPFTLAVSHLTNYSAYGVVGALLLMLTWIYVASCILLFGGAVAAIENERSAPVAAAPDPGPAHTAEPHRA